MSLLRKQVESLARRFGGVQSEFGSFDCVSLLKGADFQMSCDAAAYFADALPSLGIPCGGVRLLGAGDVLEESVHLLPGCVVARLGFIPIGRTHGGDVYALDCESGKVYELSHEKYNRDFISPGWMPDFSGFLPDVPITRENVVGTAEETFDELGQFLEFLARGGRG